jgi:ferrous iron transport protein A
LTDAADTATLSVVIIIIVLLESGKSEEGSSMALSEVKAGRQVEVRQITGSEKVQRFLFSLGCHEGEQITLISVLAGTYIISIKDSR